MPHFAVTLLMSILLAAILAFTGNRAVRERLYHAIYVFVVAVAAVVAGSWIMFYIET